MAALSPSSLAKRQAHKPPAKVAEQLTVLEAALGGRDALIAALSHAPTSADLSYVLGLIGDPLNAAKPLADLCASGGITAGELLEAYKAGEINRAQALATSKVGAKLSEVAEDTVRMSLPHDITCAVCHGSGSVTPEPSKKVPNPQPEPCETCGGTGVLDIEGDLEHKKLVLEMGKLLQKGGGVQLNVSQQVGLAFGSAGGSLEKLQAATDQILYGAGDPAPEAAMEGEVVEGESSPSIDPDAPIEEGDWREEPLP